MDQRPRAGSSLIAKFRSVADGRRERLTSALLELERNPANGELIAEAMREIHTLKGEAKMMGMAEINRVAHRTEEAMVFARERGFAVEPAVQTMMLSGLDLIGALLADEPAADAVAQIETFSAQVDALLSARKPVEPAPSKAEPGPRPAAAQTPAPGPRSREPAPGAPASAGAVEAMTALMRFRTLEVLSVPIERVDRVTALLHDVLEGQSERARVVQSMVRIGAAVQDRIRACQMLLRSLEVRGTDGGERAAEDLGRMRAQLAEATMLQADSVSSLTRYRETGFNEGLWLREIDELFRETRMVPLSALFQLYPRAVRDLALSLGKRARLETRGEAIGVDKNVLDQIGEPLLHLIRNAIDHGIEPPDERVGAGKPAEGCIRLEAASVGARLHVLLADDGRGVALDRVREAATSRGLLDQASAASASDDQLYEALFQPGFSTSESVSDVSGRGVGLDVVRRRIEELGGSVSLTSRRGESTEFRLEVPLSLAMIDVVLVRQPEGIYGIPSPAVVTVVDLEAAEIENAPGGPVVRHHDEVVPVADLAAIIGNPVEEEPAGGTVRLVVLGHMGKRLALRVHAILGERSLIQKKPASFIEGLSLLAGIAALGEGGGVLILSVPELFAASRRGGRRKPRAAAVDLGTLRAPRILVVEDSEITRIVLVEILRTAGYQVLEAVDGRQALEALARDLTDLIMTDLDMPVMDGFELLGRLRSEERTKALPVVVFSARGAESDPRRALDLGADAYLVKARFRESEMLETVRRFLPEPRARGQNG